MQPKPMPNSAVLTALTSEELTALVRQAVRDELASSGSAKSEYLTAESVAELLGVHVKTVQKWVERDGLPALRAGRHYRFIRANVVEWLESRSTKPGAQVGRHVARSRLLK